MRPNTNELIKQRFNIWTPTEDEAIEELRKLQMAARAVKEESNKSDRDFNPNRHKKLLSIMLELNYNLAAKGNVE